MIQIDVERMAGKELVVRAKQFINEIDVRFRELAKDYDYLEKEYKGLKEKYEDLKQEESEPQYDYEAYNEGVAKGEQRYDIEFHTPYYDEYIKVSEFCKKLVDERKHRDE